MNNISFDMLTPEASVVYGNLKTTHKTELLLNQCCVSRGQASENKNQSYEVKEINEIFRLLGFCRTRQSDIGANDF